MKVILLFVAFVSLAACATPASLPHLLEHAETVVQQEAEHLRVDQQRDQDQFDRLRQSMAEALQRDIEQQEQITPDWARSAAEGYAAAREALEQRRIQRQRERERRIDNLHTVSEALGRAHNLIHAHDRIMDHLEVPSLLSSRDAP